MVERAQEPVGSGESPVASGRITHKLFAIKTIVGTKLPDQLVALCTNLPVSMATTLDKAVTCKNCQAMMATADRARELQKIPPERWP